VRKEEEKRESEKEKERRDLTASLGEENMDSNLESGSEYSIYGKARGARSKLTVKKSRVHLNTQHREKNQFYINITKEESRKANMTDNLKSLETEQTLIESEDQNFHEGGNEVTELVKREKRSLLRDDVFRKISYLKQEEETFKQMKN
jgi:hypothetical protein